MQVIETDVQDAPQVRSDRVETQSDASGLVFLVGMALAGALAVVLSLATISPDHTATTPAVVATH